MNNSTTYTPNFRKCSNGEDCIHPHGPYLLENKFYQRANGAFYTTCKECHKAATITQRDFRRDESGNRGELLVINKLRSLGIYAAPGKASEFKWLDIIAWGCVKIEVKTATPNEKGAFHFGMGDKRTKEKERSDFVVLVCIDEYTSYHILPSNHAAFYHADGRAKKSAQYAPNTLHRWKRAGLDNETMARYLDRWGQIETRRKEIIVDMLTNCGEPDGIEGQAQPERIEIEDDNANQLTLF